MDPILTNPQAVHACGVQTGPADWPLPAQVIKQQRAQVWLQLATFAHSQAVTALTQWCEERERERREEHNARVTRATRPLLHTFPSMEPTADGLAHAI